MQGLYYKTISSFSPTGYKCRKIISAIDWNYHADRDPARNEENEDIVTRKYNPRTCSWTSKLLKVEKDFGYIPVMMAKVLRCRIDMATKFGGKANWSANDPRHIAPTIGKVQPEPSKVLHERKKNCNVLVNEQTNGYINQQTN